MRPRNAKTVTIKALCGICGTRMNKSGSLARLAEIVAVFETIMPDKQHIEGCDKHSVKRMFSASSNLGAQKR
jgi:biotin synthase-like enzyme